jgi:hypothetical protein
VICDLTATVHFSEEYLDDESYYKLPANFPTLDAYAEYVKKNIRIGMQVSSEIN